MTTGYFYTFFVLLLIFNQNSFCICQSAMIHAVGLNIRATKIADDAWSKYETKRDFSEIKTLNDINLSNHLYFIMNENLQDDITYEIWANIDIIRNMKDLQREVHTIDKLYHTLADVIKTHRFDINEIVLKQIVNLFSNAENYRSLNYTLIEVHRQIVYNEEKSIVELADRFMNGDFDNNCLDSDVKSRENNSQTIHLQSLQQFYRRFSAIIKLIQVKYLLIIRMSLEIAQEYSEELIKFMEEINSNEITEERLKEVSFALRMIEDYQEFMKCKSHQENQNTITCSEKLVRKIIAFALKEAYAIVETMDTEMGEEIKHKLKTASRAVWRCDPKKHVENVTYTKLNNLFQGYFINPTKPNACLDEHEKDPCHITTTCTGYLWDCRPLKLSRGFFYRNNHLNVCAANTKSDRRYDYIEYAHNNIPQSYGIRNRCRFNSELTNPISYCICEELSFGSDKYVSLIPSMARDNHVVTGARFVLKDHILYIQIQEGELGPEATIINNTATWTSLSPVEASEMSIENGNLHKILWNSGRRIYLTDNPNLLRDFAVVGLGFHQSANKDLGLIIYGRRFDFASGTLFGKIRTYSNFGDLDTSEKLELYNLEVPTASVLQSSIALSNQYLQFTTTSLEADIGQNTIPFIDIQDVTTTDHTPMSGAGLYYKTTQRYGGYLGLKLYTYDIEPYFEI